MAPILARVNHIVIFYLNLLDWANLLGLLDLIEELESCLSLAFGVLVYVDKSWPYILGHHNISIEGLLNVTAFYFQTKVFDNVPHNFALELRQS